MVSLIVASLRLRCRVYRERSPIVDDNNIVTFNMVAGAVSAHLYRPQRRSTHVAAEFGTPDH